MERRLSGPTPAELLQPVTLDQLVTAIQRAGLPVIVDDRSRRRHFENLDSIYLEPGHSALSLRANLSKILEADGMDWTLSEEALVIALSGRETIESHWQLVASYDVSEMPFPIYDLFDVTLETIDPDSWEDIAGGPNTMRFLADARQRIVVVRAPYYIHYQVRKQWKSWLQLTDRLVQPPVTRSLLESAPRAGSSAVPLPADRQRFREVIRQPMSSRETGSRTRQQGGLF